jgi:hypothetical protein
MIQPIEIQLAHFKVDHIAHTTKSAIIAAQQTGQGKEMVEENLKRTQTVQASNAAAENGKIKRREEEEEREQRRGKQGQNQKKTSSGRLESIGAVAESMEAGTEEIKADKAPKSFEFYA